MPDSPLALHGGTPVRGPEKTWPTWPVWDDRERTALSNVLESGKWWYGDRVREFEEAFAAYQDAKHCVSVTSGTTAAELALWALGIGPGDEVLVPPFTFVATATTVLRTGATPVFVDVDDTWCMDVTKIEAAITPRTKAVMPVHFGGRIVDMDAVNAIAEKHNLIVVEDACHSWGSKWKGKGTGALGRCGVFSFQATKNLNAAEGGAILTDDDALAAKCRSLANCGRVEGGAWFEHHLAGTNARLTEFQGALLSAQMTRMDEHFATRKRNAATLDAALGQIPGLTPQPGDERITHRAYHIYCLRFDDTAFGCSRAKFVEAAQAEGLPIGSGYPLPLYRQPLFKTNPNGYDYSNVNCPTCEDLCTRSATWFGHTTLLATDSDMEDIIAIIKKVHANASTLA